jgi:ribose transport system ATP-binding protein
VGYRAVADTDTDDLFELIVGRRREEAVPAVGQDVDTPHAVLVSDVGVHGGGSSSFQVAPGEVVGLTGLLGSGFEELPYILFGARPDGVGRFVMNGQTTDVRRLRVPDALAKGIALVPGDRLRSGLIDTLGVDENAAMLQLPRFVSYGVLVWRRVKSHATSLIAQYKIKAPSVRAEVLTLSGGNQQRVLLAKWLETRSHFLLLHEPVQGVDVSARIEITKLIRQHADDGTAVLCASSDYEFLSEICNRVLVFRMGTIVEELTRESRDRPITRDRIEWACLYKGATTHRGSTAQGPGGRGPGLVRQSLRED